MSDEHLDLAYDSAPVPRSGGHHSTSRANPVPYTYVFSLQQAPTITAKRCSWTWARHHRGPPCTGAVGTTGSWNASDRRRRTPSSRQRMTMTGTLSWGSVSGNRDRKRGPCGPAVVSIGRQRRRRDWRHPVARARVAHHQPGQSRGHQHLATVDRTNRNAPQPFPVPP